MSLFIVDVESDGPAPGLFSMVSFGAIRVDGDLATTFYGQTRPITDRFLPENLAVSGTTREAHLQYEEPLVVMTRFADWIQENSKGKPGFVSDNIAFDWQFINYYLHAYVGHNPFGHSGRRIGDLYCGLVNDWFAGGKWRQLSTTPHTHHPVDDARGAAEALLALARQYNLRLPK